MSGPGALPAGGGKVGGERVGGVSVIDTLGVVWRRFDTSLVVIQALAHGGGASAVGRPGFGGSVFGGVGSADGVVHGGATLAAGGRGGVVGSDVGTVGGVVLLGGRAGLTPVVVVVVGRAGLFSNDGQAGCVQAGVVAVGQEDDPHGGRIARAIDDSTVEPVDGVVHLIPDCHLGADLDRRGVR